MFSHLSGRKRLIFLKENPNSIPDIHPGEEVVIPCENETGRLASVRSNRFVVSEAEFLDVADPFDVVTEFSRVTSSAP